MLKYIFHVSGFIEVPARLTLIFTPSVRILRQFPRVVSLQAECDFFCSEQKLLRLRFVENTITISQIFLV